MKKERNSQIINEYRNGMDVVNIAKRYDISRQRVYQILQAGSDFASLSKERKQLYMDRVLSCIIDYKTRYNGNSPGIKYLTVHSGMSNSTRTYAVLRLLERHNKIILYSCIGSSSKAINVIGSKWIPPENIKN